MARVPWLAHVVRVAAGYVIVGLVLPALWAFAVAYALKRVDERRPPSTPGEWLEPDYSI